MVWLPEGEKKSEDMFTHFNRILKRDGQTDGRTDRQTDALMHSIARQKAKRTVVIQQH